jgi:hypothetical protein
MDTPNLEVFKIHYEGPDQIPHLESTRYPGVFLRIDAQNLTAHQPNGGGTINGSFGKTEDTKLHDIFYV